MRPGSIALRLSVLATVLVLTTGIRFLAGLTGSEIIVLLTAGILSFLPYCLRLLLEGEGKQTNLILPALVVIAGLLFGAAINFMLGSSVSLTVDLVGVVLVAIINGVFLIIDLRNRSLKCSRCERSLERGYYVCPRCNEYICSRSNCWKARDCQCSDCYRLRRPLLALNDDNWWQQRVGPRIMVGRCWRCGLDASNCDLRSCGDCPWPMCTQCWDFGNGLCPRCRWMIGNLPHSLEQCVQV